MAAIGPKYLPCSVITACRCFTSCSGLACANTAPAATPSANATTVATPLLFMLCSPCGVLDGPTPRASAYSLMILSQPGRIFGHCPDLAVVHVRGNAAHHAVHIVGALAFPEGGELGCDVLGVLASEAGELRRYPGPRPAMAARAGRKAAHPGPPPPHPPRQRPAGLVGSRRGPLRPA